MKNIITPEWLVQNLNNPDIAILDCRFEMGNPEYGRKSYGEAHIKNALFVDLEDDLTGEIGTHGGRHPLPDMKTFLQRIEEFGISDETTVIVYDDGDLPAASRLWWMLKYIGKEKVYVLEGGLDKWKALGFETQSSIPERPNKGKLALNIHQDMLCDVNYVRDNLTIEDSIVIDSRARERYLGLVEPIDKKAGHIPGAVNSFWLDILDGDKLKNNDGLKELFKGVSSYRNIIVHCGSGITACPNFLAMDEIGLKPVLYAGGWSDWISYKDNKVESEV